MISTDLITTKKFCHYQIYKHKVLNGHILVIINCNELVQPQTLLIRQNCTSWNIIFRILPYNLIIIYVWHTLIMITISNSLSSATGAAAALPNILCKNKLLYLNNFIQMLLMKIYNITKPKATHNTFYLKPHKITNGIIIVTNNIISEIRIITKGIPPTHQKSNNWTSGSKIRK